MSGINDIFAKRRAKKGAKKFAINLNNIDDGSTTQTEEETNAKAVNETTTFEDTSNKADTGWVEDIQRKKVVHTGGKQVSEFLNMDDLKTVDDLVAERVYMEERKKEFAGSRSAAMKKEEEEDSSNKEHLEKEKKKVDAPASAVWRAKSVQKKMSVDAESKESFPTLKGAKKVPVKSTAASGVWGSKPINLNLAEGENPKENSDEKPKKSSSKKEPKISPAVVEEKEAQPTKATVSVEIPFDKKESEEAHVKTEVADAVTETVAEEVTGAVTETVSEVVAEAVTKVVAEDGEGEEVSAMELLKKSTNPTILDE